MEQWAEDSGTDTPRRGFSAGETLFYAGAPATELYLIGTGRVQLFKRARGVERSIGLYGPEELLGEEALLPGTHRNATAQAIEPTQALVIESDTFRALVRRRPELGERVMRQLIRRLQRTEEQLDNFHLADPTIRVLNTLLRAFDDSGEELLELSPLELSTRTALALDQTKAVVAQLRDRGYLSVGDQTITIGNPSVLRQLQALLSLKEDVRHGLACR
ncbi:MAG: Crp/Fnr family transcriptional regulator [Deltaproteobacteria bacterium]|nr:Crp/Fnr family transcriptional regulator [Deltaproteobacteria bacterium]NND29127.1 Crp/Fnr family transcriptional regulator [Myxococcales bacterium]MBT8463462.1 Crp/Fnr family transcriptional regulator [Deltaproteobacteria bacterium]MBT8481260.1 Crp/Fnr family transcriptional regulator [Deltaproteobacteria bacterium]NNK08558.1 Crp/Fnr family transcriptional regulator [Myxococcales bacterium]